MTWSPAQYLKFEDERSRPARDLLVRVPLDRPGRIVDLGCGPGNSTELLVDRYREAAVVGLDSSAEMLVAARRRLPEVAFVEADIDTWTPEAPYDLIFANAVMHWVPDHLTVLARLIETCPPGGVLAMQVPDNLDEPTHRLMAEVALSGPWAGKFATAIARETIPPPAAYYDRLRPLAAHVDIWHTIYHHVLPDAAAIAEWVKGTGLRPYLDRLDEQERKAYLADHLARITEAYPPRVDGRVLLRFPRLFVVAVRG